MVGDKMFSFIIIGRNVGWKLTKCFKSVFKTIEYNNLNTKINWQFTTNDARIKLKRLYPTLQICHDTSSN